MWYISYSKISLNFQWLLSYRENLNCTLSKKTPKFELDFFMSLAVHVLIVVIWSTRPLNERKAISILMFSFRMSSEMDLCFIICYRMPPPELPQYQDCHELWSKKRRRQQREQLAAASTTNTNNTANNSSSSSQGPGGGGPLGTDSGPPDGSSAKNSVSAPSSEKLNEDSMPG